ncbi:MAG: plastocyanin/azurin family copper-binding protein [Halolamina sp.]
MVSRRRFLQLTGAVGLATTVAGCAGDEPTETDEPTATASSTASATETATSTPTETATETGPQVVDIGPEGRLRFDPEEIEINVGDTVEWIAHSEGHNVTSNPDA